MRCIKEIVSFIEDEMKDAEKYIHYAAKTKGTNESSYSLAASIAQQEMEHAEKWHSVVVRMISEKREQMKAKSQETPAFMLELWEEEHKKFIEKFSELKYQLETVKK